ncbi:hypothetical protein [Spirosoma fluviale]|uniref:Glucosyl transferase GtrII n=1 Tax=Spirosoma fluviale TaxID=1597977 RepID=A0A286F8E3_9BACT|nr:hypothetical protein [Spirosoma fluviale]SOD79498.1 hypothetical protein SAMN06269250_0979 [Spirosoma fluviale]
MVFNLPQSFFKASLTSRIFWLTGLLVPIFIHFRTVNQLAVNMPFMDDYTFLVDAMVFQRGGHTLRELMSVLLAPHGPHKEHMIVFARLAALLDYFIEGHVNFKTLFFVGNATLVATALLLILMARRAGLSAIQALPLIFLLFQPQYYESTITWAICSLQHLPALFFAFLSFYLLSRPSRVGFIASFPIALLAVFSNGNGMAVPIAGCILLLVGGFYRRLTVWALFSLVVLLLSRYVSSLHEATVDLTNISHPLRVLAGFFLASGSMGVLITRSLVGLSMLGVGIQGMLAIIVLLLMLQITTVRNWTRPAINWLHQKLPAVRKVSLRFTTPIREEAVLPFIGCYVYIAVTLAGIAFARSIGWHYSLLVPRFIWFATVLVALGYLLGMLLVSPGYRSRVSMVVLGLSILFNLTAYTYCLGEATTIHKSLVSDLHNWRENALLITMPPNDKGFDSYYSLIVRDAVREGVYRLPQPEFEPVLAHPMVDNRLRVVKKENSYSFVARQLYELTIDSDKLPDYMDDACLLLQSDQHTFVWPIDQSAYKLGYFLMNGKIQTANNVATLYGDLLPAAPYRLGVLYKRNEHWHAVYTREFVQIRHQIQPPTGPLPISLQAKLPTVQ